LQVEGGKLEVLFHQWKNEQPYRYELCYDLAFTKRGQEPLCGGDFYTLFGVKLSHDTVLGDL
jgi:hypothetical protein